MMLMSSVLWIVITTLPATVNATEASTTEGTTNTGICGRTAQVQTAILAKIPRTNQCSQVTTVDLAAAAGALDLSRKSLTSLQADDFAGLSGITYLGLDHNSLQTVPAGLLGELTSLRHFYLTYNQLTELPEGFFSGLSELYEVRMYANELARIRQNAFTGLTKLRLLDLEFNELPTLPAGVFSGLNLVFLGLESNKLQTVTRQMFTGMNAEGIDLSHNGMTSVAADTFAEAVSLKELDLENNNLAELPAGLLKNLTKLKYVWLQNNPGANFAFTMQIERVPGTNNVVARVDEGAPFDMTTTISASGGTLPTGLTSVTVQTGRTKSSEIPINSIDGTTVTLGTAPTVSSGNFTGVTTAVGAPVTLGDATEATTLSASFPQSPYASAAHTGAADRPQVVVEFSEAVASFEKTTPSVSISNGTITSVATHTESGLINAYIFVLTPTGDDDVTFTLIANGSCDAGAICTSDRTQLTEVPGTRTVPGPEENDPSELSVTDAEANEETNTTISFTVKLKPASSETVTVDYATSNRTATAGQDYTATSGTLRFNAGQTTKTIAVAIINDTIDDDNETFTLSLSNAAGAGIDDAQATGTIRSNDGTADALTASFRSMPATHDGDTTFSFQVQFSEDIGISYAKLRDNSFTVNEGDVRGARRVNGRNDLWEITVEPDSREDITITLPGNRNCGTTGAVCTRGDDPRPLSHSPSATVAGPEEDPAVTNTAATGAPTISGTPQVDETLTASVSDMSDADGLDDARYAYQWIRGSADIESATGSSYTLVSADEGETIKVQVGFTDDAGNAESLTSAATDAVAPAPEPLTATFSGVPAEHDGSEFTFALTFSEDVAGLSYLTVRDVALSASGGTVQRARRQQQGRNQGWTIHVEPDSHAAVTVRLPAGSVASSDGRALAQSLSATVAGPVGISVADARVEEAEGAQLAFVVTLSRAASGALTVDYATSDGSAQAGVDYTAASDTLTFRAGESSQTVNVTVLDDSHDDGGETLTLTLSNPSSGRLTDAGATGTIENRDPLPRALLARFGRTAAVHVVEHVEERLQAPRAPGFRGRFAGRELRRGMERDIALNVLRQLGGTAGAGPMGAAGPLSGAPAAGTAALGMPGPAGGGGHLAAAGPMGGAALMGGAAGPDGRFDGGGLLRMGLGGGDVLTGSDFALGRETGHGGILSFWSRGAQSRFAGREGALSLGGDVRTTMVGADYAKGPLVTGLSLSHSRGWASTPGSPAARWPRR